MSPIPTVTPLPVGLGVGLVVAFTQAGLAPARTNTLSRHTHDILLI